VGKVVRQWWVTLLGGLGLALAGSAGAAVLSSFTDPSVLSPTATNVAFDVAVFQPLPYMESGATFELIDGAFAGVYPNFTTGVADILNAVPDDRFTIAITFGMPVSRVGFDHCLPEAGAIQAELFADAAGSSSLGSIQLGNNSPPCDYATAPAWNFVGAESDTAFRRMTLTHVPVMQTSAASLNFIDDFRFEDATPEPATGLVMLGSLGLVAVGIRRRRSRGQA
jgi:hypothetical protein